MRICVCFHVHMGDNFTEQISYMLINFNSSHEIVFGDGCKTTLQLQEYYLLHLYLCFKYFTLC